MKLKQLSLFLENKPGALSRPVRLLAEAGFNLLTLSIADASDYGILRLMVGDWAGAKALLEREGMVVRVTDMVALEVEDRPGGLAAVLEVLEAARINVEFMYALAEKRGGKAVLVFRFDDPDGALEALGRRGVNALGSVALFGGR